VSEDDELRQYLERRFCEGAAAGLNQATVEVESMAKFAAIWLAGLSEGRTPEQAMKAATAGWTTAMGAPPMMFRDLIAVAEGRMLARDLLLRWIHVFGKPA
jgi:hypothetical protein